MNVSQPPGRSLIPPKPNLGPEPWPKSAPLQGLWVASGAVVATIAALFFWRMLRRRLVRSHQAEAAADSLDVTPRGRLVALSNSAKTALALRFGATWRAKTTEELAVEAALEEVLGPEMFRQLIEFLEGIDRLKLRPNAQAETANHSRKNTPPGARESPG